MSLSAAQSAEDEAASASSASAPSDRKRARDDSNSTNSDEPAANKPKAGPFSWHRPDSWTGRVAPLSVPAEGRVHLLPFLLPTQICDSDNPTIIQLARSIVPRGSGPKLAAEIVRDWIRRNIRYSLDDKRSRASETLAKREGMCSNKANLQISLLRATGVACGYRLVHVTKECFRSDKMLPELFEKIHEPTVHCFCAVYLPDIDEEGLPKMTGSFYNYDATERVREANEEHVFLHEESESGETRYQDRYDGWASGNAEAGAGGWVDGWAGAMPTVGDPATLTDPHHPNALRPAPQVASRPFRTAPGQPRPSPTHAAQPTVEPGQGE